MKILGGVILVIGIIFYILWRFYIKIKHLDPLLSEDMIWLYKIGFACIEVGLVVLLVSLFI